MKVRVERIQKSDEELVLIQCYKVNEEVTEIVDFIRARDGLLSGYEDTQIYQVTLRDVYYFEGVDNKVYAYLKNHVYEIKSKLYELEEDYRKMKFFRCSKSILVNLMKIESVKPALNGRFLAKLLNGEEVIISRQYVPELKRILQI